MATVSLLRTFTSTVDGTVYTTAAFTPTAGSLMVVVVAARATVINPGVASTSDGMTFTLARRVLWGTNTQIISVYVADAVSVANSQTLTWDCTGDNSSNVCLAVYEITGLSGVGLTAVVQSAGQANGSGGATPTVVFSAPANTNNPVIFGCAVSANPAALTEPGGFTEDADIGIDTPSSGLEVAHINSGFTSDTVAAGGAAASIYGALAIEFSAIVVPVASVSTSYVSPSGSREYESKVRAYWDQIEAHQAQEQAKKDRIAELERQRAQIEAKAAKKGQIAQASAVAKRKAKLAREIEELKAETQRANEQIAELRRLIEETMTAQAVAAEVVDRKRRLLLVALAAA